MVFVDVIIAQGVDEFADFQTANVRHDMSQQCVRADVEGYTEKRICRPLIKLTMQHRRGRATSFKSPAVRKGSVGLLNLELKDRMTRRQVDVITLVGIPAADNQAARVRIVFD